MHLIIAESSEQLREMFHVHNIQNVPFLLPINSYKVLSIIIKTFNCLIK